MLALIGLGLSGVSSLTLEGIDLLKKCDSVFLENYTSLIPSLDIKKLESVIGKNVELLDRSKVESGFLVRKNECVGLIVVGDPLVATTHIALVSDCNDAGVDVKIVHNNNVLTAVSRTGLQLYKFGKVASVSFLESSSYLNVLSQNKSIGAHSLFLLDLDIKSGKFLSVSEAIKRLGFSDELIVVCSRLCSLDEEIVFGHASQLTKMAFESPSCIILPGDLHFLEEEFLNKFRI